MLSSGISSRLFPAREMRHNGNMEAVKDIPKYIRAGKRVLPAKSKLLKLFGCTLFIAISHCLILPDSNAADLASQAAAEFKKENYIVALPLFKKLIVAEPKNARAYYYLALVYLKLNDIAAAQQQFRIIITDFPRSSEASYSMKFMDEIDSKNKTSDVHKTDAVEPPKPTENYAKVDRELVEATVQAEMIRTSAKTRAQFITNQVNSMAAEMRQVMVGKAMTGRAYSDEAIDAATFDLRNQAKSIIDGGEREASDVMNRAQLRYDAETHHNK